MNKKRLPYIRRICFFLLFVLCVSAQAGCARQNDVQEDAQTQAEDAVTIWAWDENYNIVAAKEAVRRYRKKYPDTQFEIVTMTQEELITRLRSALLTDSRRSLPDIALIEDYRIQEFLRNYEDGFLPLDDIVSEQDFAACKMGVNQVGDTVYGVPFDSGVVGLFYRLDIIEQAGYTEADMQNLTWARYIEIGRQVKEKTGISMLTLDPGDLPLIRMMLQSAGAWYTKEDGTLAFADNPPLTEAVRIYKRMVDAGIARTISDWNQFIHAFQDGRVATVLSGSWVSASIIEKRQQSGKWRVAAVPRMERIPQSVNASSVGGSGWYVLKYGGHAQLAQDFLAQTFAKDTALVSVLAEKINLVSTLKAAEHCANYRRGQAFYGGQKIYRDFMRWTYEIPKVNYGTDTYGREELVADVIQQALAGEDIEKLLSKYQEQYE